MGRGISTTAGKRKGWESSSAGSSGLVAFSPAAAGWLGSDTDAETCVTPAGMCVATPQRTTMAHSAPRQPQREGVGLDLAISQVIQALVE